MIPFEIDIQSQFKIIKHRFHEIRLKKIFQYSNSTTSSLNQRIAIFNSIIEKKCETNSL